MSKFGDLRSARTRAAEPSAVTPETTPLPSPASAPHFKPPRKPGKRVDPNYVQVTAYISDELNRKVKAALLARRRERDFSGVLAELLERWLAE